MHTSEQQIHDRLISDTKHQEDTNENHTRPYMFQDGKYEKKNNTINVSQDVEMRELYYVVDRKF